MSAEEPKSTEQPGDEVLAPVPDPSDDLSHLAVFDDEPPAAGETAADGSIEAVAPAAYDDETDLALPVHGPDASTAFTPFGGSVPEAEAHPAYDRERDTGL